MSTKSKNKLKKNSPYIFFTLAIRKKMDEVDGSMKSVTVRFYCISFYFVSFLLWKITRASFTGAHRWSS